VRIGNRSRTDYGVFAGCSGFAPQAAAPGMGLAYRGAGFGWKDGFWLRASATNGPRRLAAGDTWSGTIGGRTHVPRGRDLWLTFGWFRPGAAGRPEACRATTVAARTSTDGDFFWITDHTFRL